MATQTKPAPATKTVEKPREPTQQEKDAALLEDILNRKAVFTPFQEDNPITLTAKMVIRYFAKPTKKGFTCTEAQAERFVMLCKSRGLNPYVGDAFIVGFDAEDGPEFNLITAHQALLKRAEAHPQHDGMTSGVIVVRDKEVIEYDGKLVEPGDQLIGAWSKVKRKDRDEAKYSRISLGAFNKGFGRWRIDAPGMIVKCAQADALRESYPNALRGLFTQEEFQLREFQEQDREPVQMPRAVGEEAAQKTEPEIDPETGMPFPEPGDMSEWQKSPEGAAAK